MKHHPRLCVSLAAILCLSCQTTNARDPGVDELLGILTDSTANLLDEERSVRGPDGGDEDIWVAVLPIQYKGDLASGTNDGALYAGISQSVTNSGLFAPISRTLVQVAVDEALTPRDPKRLFLREPRGRFLATLTESGFVPEYFIIPELNTLVTRDRGRVKERLVSLNLQLVDSSSGAVAQEVSGEARQTN